MKKQISKAFGKIIYLLGKDKYGDKYWLEAPSWNCDWYWGFGYVESYTNSIPCMAKDIQSHQHWDGGIDYITDRTFNSKEKAILNNLFKRFYNFKKEVELKENLERIEVINTTLIPEITKQILEILTPKFE